MVVVKVELWPMGNEAAARTLGVAEIFNDASGTQSVGNYGVRLFKAGKRRAIWRIGQVRGFPRLQLGAWDLLFRALLDCVGGRNGIRRVP